VFDPPVIAAPPENPGPPVAGGDPKSEESKTDPSQTKHGIVIDPELNKVPVMGPPFEDWELVELGDVECCVKKFNYPATHKEQSQKVANGTMYRLAFEADIEYKDSDEDVACDCQCCEFKQYINLSFHVVAAERLKPRSNEGARYHEVKGDTKGYVEDCVIPREDGTHGSAVITTALGKKPKETNVCYGGGNAVKSDERYRQTPCTLWFEDGPTWFIPVGQPKGFFVERKFLGRIFDVCNATIVATKVFTQRIDEAGQRVTGSDGKPIPPSSAPGPITEKDMSGEIAVDEPWVRDTDVSQK
jgi:hypothetical protein